MGIKEKLESMGKNSIEMRMAPSAITAVKVRQAVWLRVWTISFLCL